MPRRNLVEIFSPFILEAAELDVFVAHHVRIRCQSALHRVDGIAHHLLPVFVVERHLFEAASILLRDI